MKKIKVLIVDDHQIYRLGVKTLLQRQKDFAVVGEASDGLEACLLTEEKEPDIVLLDLHMPGMDGYGASREIARKYAMAKVLVLSMEKETRSIREVLKAGALGYVLKDAPADELLTALRIVAGGNSYFSKEVSTAIIAQINKPKGTRKLSLPDLPKLSKREREILQYIAEEMTNKEIAGKLFISPRTVDTHRRNLLKKLQVKNTAGLVKYYLKMRTNSGSN